VRSKAREHLRYIDRMGGKWRGKQGRSMKEIDKKRSRVSMRTSGKRLNREEGNGERADGTRRGRETTDERKASKEHGGTKAEQDCTSHPSRRREKDEENG